MVTLPIKLSRRFMMYVLIGIVAFTVEYVVFVGLFHVINSLIVAQSLSFISGLLISFFGNKNVTFNSTEQYQLSSVSQLWRYLVLALTNLLLSNLVIQLLVQYIPAEIAKLFVMGVIIAWNYIIFNRVIFKKTNL